MLPYDELEMACDTFNNCHLPMVSTLPVHARQDMAYGTRKDTESHVGSKLRRKLGI
jgi:hypothetical protein